MASINKKDLRLLKPGELVMARREILLEQVPAHEDHEGEMPLFEIERGDLFLVIEDFRKTNLAYGPHPMSQNKAIKVLFGDKLLWLRIPNHEQVQSYVLPAKPPKGDGNEK